MAATFPDVSQDNGSALDEGLPKSMHVACQFWGKGYGTPAPACRQKPRVFGSAELQLPIKKGNTKNTLTLILCFCAYFPYGRFASRLMKIRVYLMLRRALATGFHRISDGGRNRPLLVTVETDDGAEHDVYLKPSERPNLGVSGLISEYMGACAANDLGLPIPEAFLVELDATFIRAIHDVNIQALLFDSNPLAFGSKIDGGGWRDWGEGDRLSSEQQPIALKILVFDMLIGNHDRLGNPSNVLIRNGKLRIIDHELAFRYFIDSREPWRIGACQLLRYPGQGHVFAAALARKSLDFAAVRADWSRLPPARIMAHATTLPPEWRERQDVADGAARLLSQGAERLDECLVEIQRALS